MRYCTIMTDRDDFTEIPDVGSLEAALDAVRGCPSDRVLLSSPPGAVLTLGPLFFRALIDIVGEHHPERTVRGRIDCADAPGLALGAMRHGLDVVVDVDEETFGRLAVIGDALGLKVLRSAEPALVPATSDSCG